MKEEQRDTLKNRANCSEDEKTQWVKLIMVSGFRLFKGRAVNQSL